MNPKLTRKMLVTIVLAVILIPYLIAQDKHEKTCGGLHAAIGGEVVRRDPLATQSPYVMLTFVLLNDSDAPINTVEESWQIVIDGKELKESDIIFGNGLRPVGGWGVLKPGESYQFGNGLVLRNYFPEDREYKVSWEGKGFQSSTIVVKITPK
jgi:uncharacterized protein affecting Mg2+/Co2+ transport